MTAPDRTAGIRPGVGTFFVVACPRALMAGQPRERLPAHRLVVEPLVAAATEIHVYAAGGERPLEALLLTLAVRHSRHFEIAPSPTLVRDHPELWNAKAWQLGAVVMATKIDDESLTGIFRYCQGPEVWASRRQLLKGSPDSAIRTCERFAQQGLRAVLFGASNGIEWLNLFAPLRDAGHCHDLAEANCRVFKRFVEHNPEAANEIIYDRPPYSQLV